MQKREMDVNRDDEHYESIEDNLGIDELDAIIAEAMDEAIENP